MRRIRQPRPSGFSYLGVLFLIALLGLFATKASTAWSFATRREREQQLLFVGGEFRRALESYRRAHAGAPQPDPTELAQLLGPGDRHAPVRYLRRLYLDPITGSAKWGLIRSPQGGITGVHSLSSDVPVRVVAVSADDMIDFAHAKSYRDWVFRAASPASVPSAARSAAAPAVPQGGDQDDAGAPAPQWPDGHPPTP